MNSRASVVCLHSLVLAVAAAVPAAAQGGPGAACRLQEKLQASDPDLDKFFGNSVAVFEEVAVVGAPGDGLDHGAAYVFRREASSWNETQKLVASTSTAFDGFGAAVATWDGTILVGATGEDGLAGSDSGAVFAFAEVGGVWTEVQRFTPAAPLLLFGRGLTLREDIALVSALQGASTSSSRGAVVVFERVAGQWVERQTLLASDGHVDDDFGDALALGDELAVVGAPGNDALGNMAGAAYVFERAGGVWSETQRLTSASTTAGDRFGAAAALDGDTLLVGAPADDDLIAATTNVGSVQVFERAGAAWSEGPLLRPTGGDDFDLFGVSAALSGDLALIGAPYDDDTGAVHVLRREGTAWSSTRRWKGRTTGFSAFAFDVALHDGQALVAASFEDSEAGRSAGAVYSVGASLAAVAYRNAGSNPQSLDAPPPRIGEAWLATVDLSTTGHANALVVLTTSQVESTLSGGQVVLAGGAFLLVSPLLPSATWSLEIPADCSLVGLSLTAQALHLGGVQPFALSNALDLEVGY